MKPMRSTAPTWSILHPAFAYTPAASTDVRARFRRIQREQREQQEIAKARAEQESRERNNVRS